MKLKNNKKGFTLVELVIVIAVIAILAAVLIPTFASVIGNANKSALQSEARTLYDGILVEYAQYGIEEYCEDYVGEGTDPVTITISDTSNETILKTGMKGNIDDTAKFSDYVSNGTKITINKDGTIKVEKGKYYIEITKAGLDEVKKAD